jgi:hypothetical protein
VFKFDLREVLNIRGFLKETTSALKLTFDGIDITGICKPAYSFILKKFSGYLFSYFFLKKDIIFYNLCSYHIRRLIISALLLH